MSRASLRVAAVTLPNLVLLVLVALGGAGCGASKGIIDVDAGGDAVASADAAPVCTPVTAACEDTSQCCAGLACDDNSLGKVCCGGAGASCATVDGTDCCGALECIGGICGGAWDPNTPELIMFPVRGRHNTGYEAPSTGDSTMWTCDAEHSNSDFVAGSHLGNDIWAARGTPVAATVDGVLVYTGWSDYSGNKVTVKTSGNWYHFNCHLDSIAPGMTNGRIVKAGEIIGTVGNTGTASNGVVHLHYSIYRNDNYNAGIDPWPHLRAVEQAVCQ